MVQLHKNKKNELVSADLNSTGPTELKIIPSTPLSETHYTGQHPDMPEFERPWENCIQVSQGDGEISSDGTPLHSEGMSKCIPLLLKNKVTGDVALFHIDDCHIDLNGAQLRVMKDFMEKFINDCGLDQKEKDRLLSANDDVTRYFYPESMKGEAFQEQMNELNRDGKIRAKFLFGSNSRRYVKDRVVGSVLGYLGVVVEDDINVDTGDQTWGMLYKPKENRIYVDSRNHNKVLKFPF